MMDRAVSLEQEIQGIREGVIAGLYSSEAAVSQGIVLRLLSALGWPAYDTRVVWPEYSLGGRRVDYALCHPAGKPIAIIEVKQVGLGDGAERQLFEYAFHEGVPLAILTDGREWSFFLPGEQGDYGERRVYKLDLVERDLGECAARLTRYLLHSAVSSGTAIQAARDDYRLVTKDREMQAAMPKAWAQLIAHPDEALLEIVADRVETLCGFKPDLDMVAHFLGSGVADRSARQAPPARGSAPLPQLLRPKTPVPSTPVPQLARKVVGGPKAQNRTGFVLSGTFHPAKNAIDVLRGVFEALTQRDPSFPERFAALPRHGKKRRYLARNADELYPGRPDLSSESSIQLSCGWWLGTNYSRRSIAAIIEMACDVARLKHGRDVIPHLG